MPEQKLALRRAAMSLIFAALLVLSTAIIAYRADVDVQETGRWVAHTNEVISELTALLEAVRESESEVRAFVLTGDSDYLQSYEVARTRSSASITALTNLIADNP